LPPKRSNHAPPAAPVVLPSPVPPPLPRASFSGLLLLCFYWRPPNAWAPPPSLFRDMSRFGTHCAPPVPPTFSRPIPAAAAMRCRRRAVRRRRASRCRRRGTAAMLPPTSRCRHYRSLRAAATARPPSRCAPPPRFARTRTGMSRTNASSSTGTNAEPRTRTGTSGTNARSSTGTMKYPY
jgi:hypothetical protein